MIYVKVNNTLYPAEINGHMIDHDWDNRDSKYITLSTVSAEEAKVLFTDDTPWSIVNIETEDVYNANPETGAETLVDTVINEIEYNNDEYSVLGDIIAHRNGTVTVKMGKPTANELLEMLIGGITE